MVWLTTNKETKPLATIKLNTLLLGNRISLLKTEVVKRTDPSSTFSSKEVGKLIDMVLGVKTISLRLPRLDPKIASPSNSFTF